MKINDRKDLRNKNTEELKKLVSQTQVELSRAMLERKMGKQTNTHTGLLLRKKIATIKTVIREKELGVSK